MPTEPNAMVTLKVSLNVTDKNSAMEQARWIQDKIRELDWTKDVITDVKFESLSHWTPDPMVD